MNIAELHKYFLAFPIACTDTRKIEEGCIFFALKGANFNGNTYAQEALKKGAAYAVVDEAAYDTSEKTLLVDDVLEALQSLGTFHRNYCKARVISLTGSNGKTTTKELIYAVLSKKYKTIATYGNLNNHIGVPLTLLTIQPSTEFAIVEMGANHKKEIAFLCELAQPDFGYITNFGKAHLEGFGGTEGVIEGKSELYDYLTTHNKYIFLNADDPIQEDKLSKYIKKFGYSTHQQKYYPIQFLSADPFVQLGVEDTKINSQLIGKYNFTNCCAAVLIGKYFNVSLEAIANAIANYIPENNRSQLIEQHGNQIILDAYNANPSSMKAALENFKAMSGVSKTVFLGDMFELGDTAAQEHQEIADLVNSMAFDTAYLVGVNFNNTTTSLATFANYETLAAHLKTHNPPKSTILIKGSRGMALERLLEIL